jgi:crotonobetainyl-CoA:carnitine CoA-transferase CaiB-like acyl-CoA transferase
MEELTDDPRFNTGKARNENRQVRLDLTERALGKFTVEEATKRLDEHQVPNAIISHPRHQVIHTSA